MVSLFSENKTVCGNLILRNLSNCEINLSTIAYKTTRNFVLFFRENICQLGIFLVCDTAQKSFPLRMSSVNFFGRENLLVQLNSLWDNSLIEFVIQLVTKAAFHDNMINEFMKS